MSGVRSPGPGLPVSFYRYHPSPPTSGLESLDLSLFESPLLYSCLSAGSGRPLLVSSLSLSAVVCLTVRGGGEAPGRGGYGGLGVAGGRTSGKDDGDGESRWGRVLQEVLGVSSGAGTSGRSDPRHFRTRGGV